MKIYRVLLVLVLLLGVAVFFNEVSAQCSMCKKTAEDSGKAEGINMAIAYLAAFPYALFGIVAYVWYRKTQKVKAAGK
ncbi:MAG: hypothetical protein ACJ75J_16945 [Cytophagaceae bacterium]